MVWLDKPLVLAIHARQVAEYGGLEGIRDENMLDSALARPRQLAAYADPEPDVEALAASVAFGLACNHPFLDGNKRTAAVGCETFLRLNGTRLVATDADFYTVILALAEGHVSESEFAAWLRERTSPNQHVLHESTANYG